VKCQTASLAALLRHSLFNDLILLERGRKALPAPGGVAFIYACFGMAW